jgi:hypothetical protein
VDTIDGEAFYGSDIREIRISEGNHHFRVVGEFLVSFDGKFLHQWLGRDFIIRIPSEIEVICEHAFSIARYYRRVEFETDSSLRRIEAWAFSNCTSIRSFCIPSHVDTIEESAFLNSPIREISISEGNCHFRICGDFLVTTNGSSLVWYFGVSSNVTVVGAIRSLSAGSFPPIRPLVFEPDSQLRRIDSRAFSNCGALRAICIPSSVERIDGSAFGKSGISEIRVAEGNNDFIVCGPFLVNSD